HGGVLNVRPFHDEEAPQSTPEKRMLREVRPSVPNEIKPADASLRTRRHILDKVKEARPHEQQQARGSDQAGQSQLDRFSAPECTEQQEWHKEAYPCRTGKGE